MTRKIKFRAWALDYPNCTDHKLPKKMFYYVGVTDFDLVKWDYIVKPSPYIDYSSGNSKDEDYEHVQWFDFDVELMQYTGLKDKNGQQAYQGDLIRPWDDDRIYQIIWDDDYARFDCKQVSGHKWPCEMLLVRTSEIIGNIHENPELLEKQ